MIEPDTTDHGCCNLRWSLALFDGLIAGGMRRLVLSPGSRSTPLVLAGQRQPVLELTPILDERSAAFFALGLAQASGRPVGLLCTSGSALAHWLPAVIEASESEIPLILLSADRPAELRGWGANQTIDQTRLFGGFVREFHDPGLAEDHPAALKMIRALGVRVAAVSQGRWPGPVHLNLPFREPLVPQPACLEATQHERSMVHDSLLTHSLGTRKAPLHAGERGWGEGVEALMSGRGLICCGPGNWSPTFAESLWVCAERLAVPVLCDPLSGLRFGLLTTTSAKHRITRYDSLLRHPQTAAALKPDWVLRIGRAPVSKILLGWLADIPTILIHAGQGWSDPNYNVWFRINADPTSVCAWLADLDWIGSDTNWCAQWAMAEHQMEHLTADYLAQAPWCEAQLLVELLSRLPAEEGLLCANSMPIRQLDSWSGSRDASLRVFGNRGASGIDGQSSTLAGLNAGGIPTTGLLGDLSFLHDLSGLLLLRQLERPCIVLNNGGGRIFDYLPQHGLPGFAQFWRTPVELDLGDLLRPFGIAHRVVSDGAGFREALDSTSGVIEVMLDGAISQKVHQTFWRGLLSGISI